MDKIDSHTTLEQWLLDTCRELGLPVKSLEEDFFDAGGTSLSVVRLISKVDEKFGEDVLTPDNLIERSALREIAGSIRKNAVLARD